MIETDNKNYASKRLDQRQKKSAVGVEKKTIRYKRGSEAVQMDQIQGRLQVEDTAQETQSD